MHALHLIVVVTSLFTLAWPTIGVTAPVTVSKTDKCPICGMFVAKYPDFQAQIVFTDGSYAVFDGAKDMFKYYFNLKKYNPSKKSSDVAFVYVTDYYNITQVDGRSARYVVGSDVFGPMGRELIPIAQEKDAEMFMKDHSGKKIIGFDTVTPSIINELD